MRILHVLHNSLPYLSGYSIRANYIIRCLSDMGIESAVVTSAQQQREPGAPLREEIDGIQYRRTKLQPKRRSGLREIGMMHALRQSINKAIEEWQPDIIHAASPVLVGLPALYAARRHKLPLVYEVRDLWENASVDRGKWKYDSLPYRGAAALESILFTQADAVVTICSALRNEIAPRMGRHVPLHVIPNGVQSDQFVSRPPSQTVRDTWKLHGKTVIGYIGAFQPYEGLETLIDAMPAIAKAIPNAHLMITGGGNDLETELRNRAAHMTDLVTFTGRVPHSEVQEMYSVVDLMVYPRISTRTTELTTPLKPLEAMALNIPVALSNTKAMMEIIEPGVTGFSFRAGDVDDLADSCIHALKDDEYRAQVVRRARKYVETERHWTTIVSGYSEIYQSVLR